MRIYKLDIPDLFRLTAVVGFVGGLVYFISYHFIAKRFDKHLIAKLDSKYPDRWKTATTSEETFNYTLAPEHNVKIAHF